MRVNWSGVPLFTSLRRAVVPCALLSAIFFSITGAQAQGSRKQDIVMNRFGQPVAGATVTVCTAGATGTPCSPLAAIYSNVALSTVQANPFNTDGLGNYAFYAAPGRYLIQFSGAGLATTTIPDVILPCDPSNCNFSSISVTNGISAFSLTLSGNLAVSGTVTTGVLNPASISTAQIGAAPVQLGPTWFPGTATALAPAPAVAPTVALESASGGAITAQNLYCVITYGNKNGETLQSPVSTVLTTVGATNQIKVHTTNDIMHYYGTYKMRTYCGNAAVGPFTKMIPKTVKFTAVNNGLSRTSNVATVTFPSAAGFARNQLVTVSGDAGCAVSFSGTYRLTATSFDSKTFTFPQTAADQAACGGAAIVVSYSTAIDTDWAWVVDGGGYEVVYDTNPAGANPPGSNTATIDSIQVALNAARLANNYFRQGYVVIGGGSYALTTPLILGADGPLLVGQQPTTPVEGGSAQSTTLTCGWNDVNTGCVMIMGRRAEIDHVFINATTGDTHGVMVLPGNSNLNGIYIHDSAVAVNPNSPLACALDFFRDQSSFQNTVDRVTLNGGRGAICAANVEIAPLTVSTGRLISGSVVGVSTEVIGDGGPTDWARGTNFGGLPSTFSVDISNVDGESNRAAAIDIVDTSRLSLTKFTNSDVSQIAAGTKAAALSVDGDFWGAGSPTIFLNYGTFLFGSPQATQTINFPTTVKFICNGATVQGSGGGSIGINFNNLQPNANISGCTLLTMNPTGASVIAGATVAGNSNTFIFTPFASAGGAVLADAVNVTTGPQKVFERNNSTTGYCQSTVSGVWTLWWVDCVTKFLTVDLSGNLSALGTLSFGGFSANKFTFAGAATGARSIQAADGNMSIPVVGSLTTTAAATDNVTLQGATASSHCSLTATNATAATDSTSTYVSSKIANQITVTHPASAGRNWDILCTAN
ncbi:MAG: hypothetical protein GZ088_13300 [Acidipila sp.]|nr:hypothetical protein [Acidipila sp.]